MTMKSADEKKKVMSVKSKLKDHKQYSKVYIDHDKSRTDRLIESNFRAILTAVKQGNTNLSLRGARVVRNAGDGETRSGSGRERSPSPSYRDSRRRADRSPVRSGPREERSRGERSRDSQGRSGRRGQNGGVRSHNSRR